ncbi:DUF3187 family protein [Deltaproteobacteria bacterium TL4]
MTANTMKIKHILLLLSLLLQSAHSADFAWGKTQNAGLGPLELRSQYPVTQRFLSMYPENTATVGEGQLYTSYRATLANTFINSEGFTSDLTHQPQITATEVRRGLEVTDFYDPDLKGNVITQGFRVYIDVESLQQLIRFKYGLTDSLEIGFELPLFSFNGGSTDSMVEGLHDLIGIGNEGGAGAYRSLSEQNRYDFYVVKDGEFIVKAQEPFESVPGDLVTGLKWNMIEGGAFVPAFTLKLSYKFSTFQSDKQELVTNKKAHWGYYLLLSKGFKEWVVYLGKGKSILTGESTYAKELRHDFIAMEYRFNENFSFVFQSVTQSSIFPREDAALPRGSYQDGASFSISSPTSVLAAGLKSWIGDFFIELGMVEDYSQAGNETDVVFYSELGVLW